jgi:putative Mg2+ transporter-C (MgtC) family protein
VDEVINLTFNWQLFLQYIVKFGIAFLLTLPVAWEREFEDSSLGLRTLPIVAVASCGYLLLSLRFAPDDNQAQARLVQGLITGIGFIGGGAILKNKGRVEGTATAASVWSTGLVGASVAYGFYEIAVVVSLVNLLVLQVFTRLKEWIGSDEE